MRINDVKNINAVVIDGQEIKDLDLGARLSKHGGLRLTVHCGAEDDIKSNLGKAAAAFNKLTRIWRSGQLSKNTKIRIFKFNVIAVYSMDARLRE